MKIKQQRIRVKQGFLDAFTRDYDNNELDFFIWNKGEAIHINSGYGQIINTSTEHVLNDALYIFRLEDNDILSLTNDLLENVGYMFTHGESVILERYDNEKYGIAFSNKKYRSIHKYLIVPSPALLRCLVIDAI